MRVILLGTGTPVPSLRRMSSGYLVDLGENGVILLDHGPGAYHRMLEAGYGPTQVTDVFFSHLHFDHCLDYQRLVLTRWDQSAGDVPELNVYGPPPIGRMTELAFGPDGIWDPDLTARTQHPLSLQVYAARGGVGPRPRPAPVVTELGNNDTVDGNGWHATVRSVRHAQPYLACYGIRLETPAGTVAYTGDTGPCKAVERLAEGADILLGMCSYESGHGLGKEYDETCMGHLELAQLGQTAGVGALVISHVHARLDMPGVRERLIHEMSAIYDGTLYFGEDLMEIPLG